VRSHLRQLSLPIVREGEGVVRVGAVENLSPMINAITVMSWGIGKISARSSRRMRKQKVQ
jgi:hypothetical protein